MKKVILAVCLMFLVIGCASNKILVTSLDKLIIESATKAQASGANNLKIETSITSGIGANASVPISVVPVGANAKLEQSTKITIEISDLKKWKPTQDKAGGKDYYILDTSTNMLEDVK
jgi:uncharacterized protein YcfL